MANIQSLNESSVIESFLNLSIEQKSAEQEFKAKHQLSLLKQTQQELQKFKVFLKSYNISVEDIGQAMIYAFEKLFSLKSPKLIQNIKNLTKLILQIAQGIPKQQNKSPNQMKKDSQDKKNKDFNLQDNRISSAKNLNHSEPNSNKSVFEQSGKDKKEQSSYTPKDSKIYHPKQFVQFDRVNPKQQSTPSKTASIFSTQDSQNAKNLFSQPKVFNIFKQNPASQNQQKKQNPYTFQTQTGIPYPLVWENNAYFTIKNRAITKSINDDYRKLGTQLPLKEGCHTLKFRMIKVGTVAFGIVSEQNKNGIFIDDRRYPAVKFISFSNGKGMIKYQGHQLFKSSYELHLQEGSTIQICYNSKQNSISFVTNRMPRPYMINLKQNFRNRRVFFYIEMKHYNTQIQQI